MQKIGSSTDTANAASEFTAGDPAAGVAATLITAPWLNSLQRELSAVVVAAGLALDAAKDDQVLTALKVLVQGRLLRTSVFTIIGGAQVVSVNGGAFTSVGASAFVPIAGAKQWDVEVLAGGGGGGGTVATGAAQICMGTGGQAGGYARSLYSSMAASTAITVGAGGLPGAAGFTGAAGTGGPSSFGALITAPGGTGGYGSSVISVSTSNIQIGGVGAGTPTGGNVVNYAGMCGGFSVYPTGSNLVSGSGGSTIYGVGGSGRAGNVGAQGQGYGSGGGGAAAIQGTPALIGGGGAPGVEIIREYA